MRRALFLLLCVVAVGGASLAQAQQPAPPTAAKKATRRSPSSLGPAKDDAAEPEPSKSELPGPDTALLRGLLAVFEPAPTEVRVLAVEDLALLGDPRALNPLAQLVLDANPAVQTAAVRAISRFATPRAEEVLTNIVRHPTVAERLKVLAVEALSFQRTRTSRDFLERLGASNAYGYALQNAARKAAQEWGPLPAK